MRISLNYTIDVSEDKADALQDSITSVIEDHEVTVIAESVSIEDNEYTVIGSVRGKPEESWHSIFRATSPSEAKAIALTSNDKLTVTGVLLGAVKVDECGDIEDVAL